MDTPFEKLDVESRREWLDHPVTMAYLRTLAEQRRSLVDNLIDLTKGGLVEPTRIARMGGQIGATEFAIELAKKE